MSGTILDRMIDMMNESGFVPKKWGIRAKGTTPFFLVDDLGSPRLFETGKDAARWAESKLTSFLADEFDVVNLANAQVYRAGADEPGDQAAAPVAHQWKAGDRAKITSGLIGVGMGGYLTKETSRGYWIIKPLFSYSDYVGHVGPVSEKDMVPEPDMIEEPDHDTDATDEPEASAPNDTDYILDLIRSTIEDGYQANVDGDTTAVARAFGRIEGMLDGIELAILDDEPDE